MYDFPPSYWAQIPWWPAISHICAMVFACGTFFWLLRKKRTPRSYDVSLMLIASFIATFILAGPRERYGLPSQSAHFTLYIALWGGTFMAIVFATGEYELRGKKSFWTPFITFATPFVGFGLFLSYPISTPREASRRTQCKNNLKQIGLGLLNYHDTHEAFPASRSGEPQHSWRIDMLPYVNQEAVFEEYDFHTPWNTGSNRRLARTEIAAYQCPSNDFPRRHNEYPATAYAALTGEQTIWPGDRPVAIHDIQDGTSNTLAVVEACGRQIPWSEPRDVPVDELTAGINLSGDKPGQSNGWMSSYHAGGTQVLLADGSVRFLSQETDESLLRALSTRASGEVVEDF